MSQHHFSERTTSRETILENRKQLIVNGILCRTIPRRFIHVAEQLRLSKPEKALFLSLITIELSARPWYLRCPEILLACGSIIAASLLGIPLRNVTVGPMQIGILTSLRWTRNELTIHNYLRRLMLLFTAKGSCRVFRIGFRHFMSEHDSFTGSFAERFSNFYNGLHKMKFQSIRYSELLDLLLSNSHHAESTKVFACVPRKGILLKSPEDHRAIFSKIDSFIKSRLDKMRVLVKEGDKIIGSVVLCSRTTRKVIYSSTFTNTEVSSVTMNNERLAGSTLKIALYSAFLEKYRIPVETKFEDRPLSINWSKQVLQPRNSDGKFRGMVTLEYAFANSINTVAVQMLQIMGVESFVKHLRKCGIYSPIPNTPLLALGPIRLNAWNLLGLMSPIVHNGHFVYVSNDQNNYPPPGNNGEQILSRETVISMRRLLHSTTQIGTARFLNMHSNITGGKTGTSERARDLWFVGFLNENIYGLVWIGRQDCVGIETIDGHLASASRFAVPVWSDLLGFDWNFLA